MLNAIEALVNTKPTTGPGHRIVDAGSFAVDVIGVVAPVYQADIDEINGAKDTAESLASQRNDELIAVRAEVDNLRLVLAETLGQLNSGDVDAAKSALNTI
jgi:hypothetical protein